MKHCLAVLLLAVLLVGCITTTYPDGRVEERIDYEVAELALRITVLAYNAYRDSSDPAPSRLTELLDNVDRAMRTANMIRDALGKEPLFLTADLDGTLEIEGGANE